MNSIGEHPTQPILVLGSTGKTGRRVAERLTTLGLNVRPGTRTGHPPFDWEDRATWIPALDGVKAVYITYYPDLAVPSAADAIRSFAHLAVDRGVNRLVLLSGRAGRTTRRAGAHGRWDRLDDPARELVRAELQRELPARADPGR